MAKGNPNPSPTTRFSADNPSRAKQKGARDRLSTKFLTALADDFETNGAAVLEEVRKKDPATYMRVCASILPKELEIGRQPLDDISDDALAALIETVKDELAKGLRERAHDEAGTPIGTKPTLQ